MNGSGRLVPFAGSSERAWFVCYSGSCGVRRFYRHDLPGTLRLLLEDLPENIPFEDSAAVERILGDRLVDSVWSGFSGTVPAGDGADTAPEVRILAAGDGSVVAASDFKLIAANAKALAAGDPTGPRERPVAGAFADDRLVSICESSRENDEAAEAWVQTVVTHRRRGFGRKSVAGWAAAIRAAGKVPLYSYSDENEASAALLRSLGGREFARVVAYG